MIGVRPGLVKTDELEEKIKARGVWAYPAAVKVMEMRFVIPLMDRMSLQFGKHPYATGVNMTKMLPCVIDHLLREDRFGCVTDVSAMDTSVGPDWIHWAFDFMKSKFFMGKTQSSVTRNNNVWDFLEYYFTRTPILLPSGQLLRKYGGVPSGSGFTQLVDTLVNLLAATYSLLVMGYSQRDILQNVFCVGDDLALSVTPDFNLEKFCILMTSLGFSINQSKVMFSNNGKELTFLGYSRHGGFVHRTLDEFLKSAYFPESFVGTEERSRQRILAQLIAGGMSSSGFGRLVFNQFVDAGYRPLSGHDVYLPGKRWMSTVLGMPSAPLSMDTAGLFRLV